MTIEEASEFWDTHDVTDYSSHVVQFEYTPEERITFVAIANQFLSQLEQQAQEDGISIGGCHKVSIFINVCSFDFSKNSVT